MSNGIGAYFLSNNNKRTPITKVSDRDKGVTNIVYSMRIINYVFTTCKSVSSRDNTNSDPIPGLFFLVISPYNTCRDASSNGEIRNIPVDNGISTDHAMPPDFHARQDDDVLA